MSIIKVTKGLFSVVETEKVKVCFYLEYAVAVIVMNEDGSTVSYCSQSMPTNTMTPASRAAEVLGCPDAQRVPLRKILEVVEYYQVKYV